MATATDRTRERLTVSLENFVGMAAELGRTAPCILRGTGSLTRLALRVDLSALRALRVLHALAPSPLDSPRPRPLCSVCAGKADDVCVGGWGARPRVAEMPLILSFSPLKRGEGAREGGSEPNTRCHTARPLSTPVTVLAT